MAGEKMERLAEVAAQDRNLYEFLGEVRADIRIMKAQLDTLVRDHAETRKMVHEHRTGMLVIKAIGGIVIAIAGLFAAWWKL